MNTTVDDFKSWLENLDVPEPIIKPKTFLGIAKQPHYENVISNIYKFYFRQEEDHGFQDLFVESLKSLISSKYSKDLDSFQNFEVKTEVETRKKGRIDLLLDNGQQAIIIENKIYHHLNNDLSDYWNLKDKKYSDKNKIGVVLSLKEVSQREINNDNFVNITHTELLCTVMEKMGSYLMGANQKYVVFLQDFYQNILNMSTPIMKDSEIEIYFENKKKIERLIIIKDKIKEFVLKELKIVGRSLPEDEISVTTFKRGTKNRFRYCYFKSKIITGLMYTVYFEKIFEKDQNIMLAVELTRDLRSYNEKFKNEIEWKASELDRVAEQVLNQKNGYLHFAKIHLDLSKDDMVNLSSVISEKFHTTGIASVFKKLEDYCIVHNIEVKEKK